MSPRKVTKALRAARRQSAEARQEYYEALTIEQQLVRAQGEKEKAKLRKRLKKANKS